MPKVEAAHELAASTDSRPAASLTSLTRSPRDASAGSIGFEGRRRDGLMAAARTIFEVEMAGRVLPFDGDAAAAYPEIAIGRRKAG